MYGKYGIVLPSTIEECVSTFNYAGLGNGLLLLDENVLPNMIRRVFNNAESELISNNGNSINVTFNDFIIKYSVERYVRGGENNYKYKVKKIDVLHK